MRTILVDVSSLLFPIALKSMDFDLYTSTGVQTTYTYSLLMDVLDFARSFKSNRFIFVFDSKHNYRKDLDPSYKAKRKNRDQNVVERLNKMFSEISLLESVLTSTGFPCIREDGYESDDIIASFVVNNPDERFIIVSSDHDMYQLMSERVEIYKPQNGCFFTMKDFDDKYPGLNPSDYWKLLSLCGCRTDEVSSVVGERTAYKFLMKKLKKDSKYYKAVIDGKDRVRFVRRLVQLPFEGTPEYKVPQFTFNKVEFFNKCSELEFNRFLENDFISWSNVFSMGCVNER